MSSSGRDPKENIVREERQERVDKKKRLLIKARTCPYCNEEGLRRKDYFEGKILVICSNCLVHDVLEKKEAMKDEDYFEKFKCRYYKASEDYLVAREEMVCQNNFQRAQEYAHTQTLGLKKPADYLEIAKRLKASVMKQMWLAALPAEVEVGLTTSKVEPSTTWCSGCLCLYCPQKRKHEECRSCPCSINFINKTTFCCFRTSSDKDLQKLRFADPKKKYVVHPLVPKRQNSKNASDKPKVFTHGPSALLEKPTRPVSERDWIPIELKKRKGTTTGRHSGGGGRRPHPVVYGYTPYIPLPSHGLKKRRIRKRR